MPRLLLSLLLFSAAATYAQSPDVHSRIKQFVDERNYPSAIIELKGLSERESKMFSERNYGYLLGRLCERTGDLACAAGSYAAVAGRDSSLREYALWHLAHLAGSSGNLIAERIYLTQLLADTPASLLADAAKQRLAHSWFESGNYASTIKELKRGEGGKGEPNRAEQILLAKSYLYAGDAASARQTFASLINSGPNPAQPDDYALDAARGLDLLDVGSAKYGKSVASLSDYEHLRRAQVYQFNRDFADAKLHFTAIIEEHPESGIAPDAIYQIGRGYSQSSEFAEALKWYERVIEQFPDHPVAKDALLQLASTYARLGRYRIAVTRYERFIEKYQDDERLDRAYLNIIDVLRDAGEETEALAWAAKTQDVFRGKAAEALALFAQSRIRLSRSDWPAALADLQRLSGLPDLGGPLVPGGTTREEVAFLWAYSLERLERFTEAIELYLSIPDGRNEYYGWRATEHLRSMASDPFTRSAIEAKLTALSGGAPGPAENRRRALQSMIRLTASEKARTELFDELRKLYASIPSYGDPISFGKATDFGKTEAETNATVRALTSLGLFDEAAPAIESASVKNPGTNAEYAIANSYLKGGRADRAAAFVESRVKLPSDFQIELLPDTVTGMLYPVPYKDELLRSGAANGVDPRFILAIMRQESRFRPNVKSNAAARGLMQFISTTADRLARDLGRTGFDQDELFHPPTAILFGSKYIGDLFVLFPELPEAVAASYNGGEDNMKRWLGRSRSQEPDRYVPEIAFAQSKDYVHRVIANFRMYSHLYDERLNGK
jgi:soluble lytic murein transglycosylase